MFVRRGCLPAPVGEKCSCTSDNVTAFILACVKCIGHCFKSRIPSLQFVIVDLQMISCTICRYRGADKSLARPGRKQATTTKLYFRKPLKKISEICPSNQVSAAAMSSASDEKWRPFNCFFSRVGLRTYSTPVYSLSIILSKGKSFPCPRHEGV